MATCYLLFSAKYFLMGLSLEVWSLQDLQKDLDMKLNFSVNCLWRFCTKPSGFSFVCVCSLLLYCLEQFDPSTIVAF